jgi:hypothetical protein
VGNVSGFGQQAKKIREIFLGSGRSGTKADFPASNPKKTRCPDFFKKFFSPFRAFGNAAGAAGRRQYFPKNFVSKTKWPAKETAGDQAVRPKKSTGYFPPARFSDSAAAGWFSLQIDCQDNKNDSTERSKC